LLAFKAGSSRICQLVVPHEFECLLDEYWSTSSADKNDQMMALLLKQQRKKNRIGTVLAQVFICACDSGGSYDLADR
jgi:hypothetical protein